MTRTDLLERYRALPLPTTKDESWRFTDLRASTRDLLGERRDRDRAAPATARHRGRRRRPRLRERASRSTARPTASGSSRSQDHPLLDALVGWDEKFAAHNAAEWKHGLLVHVPKGVVLEQPLYVRIANSVEGGSLFWRLLIVADAGQPLLGDRGVRVDDAGALRLLERRRRDLRRRRRKGRVRLGAEPLAGDLALRVAPRAGRAGRRARLGRRRLRLEEGQDPDPERPRRPGRDLARHRARTSRTATSTSTTTPSRSTSRRIRRATSPSRARFGTSRAPSGAG